MNCSLYLKSICLKPFYLVRFFLLQFVYKVLSESIVWTEGRREEYQRVFLKDTTIAEKEEALLNSAKSLFELCFLRIFFALPVDKTDGIHIDFPSWFAFKVHSFFGIADYSFESDADSALASRYEGLRHYIATQAQENEHDDEAGKTNAIFRIAPYYGPVRSICSDVLSGVSRLLNLDSREDMSNFYYQVLQQDAQALADKSIKRNILAGEVSVVAISYRHLKDHRNKLGITENELISALETLHQAASLANPSSQYCIWWDSCLKCNSLALKDSHWSAIGLAPYAFFHVLSIRRDSDLGENRFWIDVERALGRLSKGMTAVDVTGVREKYSEEPQILGIGPGDRVDSVWALSSAIDYIASGDLHDSRATFPSDKAKLEYISLKQLCTPGSFALYKALYSNTKYRIEYIKSIATLEQRLFSSTMHVRLGAEHVAGGNGEPYLDTAVPPHRNEKLVQLRYNWLPNSLIYNVPTLEDEAPPHVREQTVFYLYSPGGSHCVMQLYHERENDFNFEAIHGLVSNLDSEGVYSISRLHVPAKAQLLGAFRTLHEFSSCSTINSKLCVQTYREITDALAWLWTENEMSGELSKAVMQILPNNWAHGMNIRAG